MHPEGPDLQPLEDRRRRVHRYASLRQETHLTTGKDWRLFVAFLGVAVAIIFASLYFRAEAAPVPDPAGPGQR